MCEGNKGDKTGEMGRSSGNSEKSLQYVPTSRDQGVSTEE